MTRLESKRQYGIAILLMLFLHLFRSSDPNLYYSVLNAVFHRNVLSILTRFAGICVACYAFITGYGFAEQAARKFKQEKTDIVQILKYIAAHIIKLYKKYWFVFLIFVPLGYLNGSYQDFSVKSLILSLLGLDSTYNGAWWYVWQYVILCAVFPLELVLFDLLNKLFKKKNYLSIKNILLLTAIGGGLTAAFWVLDGFKLQKAVYGIICMLGYLSSEYGIITKGRNRLKKLPHTGLFCCGFLILLIALRIVLQSLWGGINGPVDIIVIIPYFIVICELTDRCRFTWRVFDLFGKHSTYMWLIHNFFLVTNLVVVIRITSIAALKYLILVAVSLACSWVFLWIEDRLLPPKRLKRNAAWTTQVR